MPANPAVLTEKYLIVGEGPSDAAFCRHLCEVRSIMGFQFEYADGKTNYERYLNGLQARTGFDNLEAILIVADNDETPDDSFRNVRVQLRKARLPYPDRTLTIARRSANVLAVAVMMIPFDGTQLFHGCLETLLLEAAGTRLGRESKCLDGYCDCIDTTRWARTSLDKMRLRCMLAAAWPDDPNISLQWALNPKKNLIPLDHACFNQIVEILRDFEGFVARGGLSP
jgi:hypothetical protein